MSTSTEAVRVVVQNGEYWLCNKGDLAIMAVTVERMRHRWPHGRIGVITRPGLLLSAYHPDAEPISDGGAGGWSSPSGLRRWAERVGPTVVGPPSVAVLEARERLVRPMRRLRSRLPIPAGGPRRVRPLGPEALADASMLVAMGGGYLTDSDPGATVRTLDLLEAAIERGLPTAMLGQGIGPLEDGELVRRAAEVLPRVDLIALREDRRGPQLLESLGVAPERVMVTGDDAVELAYRIRREEPGTDLGVCLRIADYSPVADAVRADVRRAVQRAARTAEAQLCPLIVSEYHSEDRRSTMPLVAGFPRIRRPLGRYAAAVDVAARVSHCRVVVTGAYHLAVFALSQGIPVVGLSASAYYDDKLYGLSSMFQGGITPLRLDEPFLEERIVEATRTAWEQAPQLRAGLLARAAAQIRLSRSAFERAFALVGADHPAPTRFSAGQ
jgi:polysaccharide pyruvyl transferase WcaK-like protein